MTFRYMLFVTSGDDSELDGYVDSFFSLEDAIAFGRAGVGDRWSVLDTETRGVVDGDSTDAYIAREKALWEAIKSQAVVVREEWTGRGKCPYETLEGASEEIVV